MKTFAQVVKARSTKLTPEDAAIIGRSAHRDTLTEMLLGDARSYALMRDTARGTSSLIGHAPSARRLEAWYGAPKNGQPPRLVRS